ncbi:Feline leukemia virus subgroup C receptor-related protein 1 [Hypsibius exemplaris]|uniref:Choline/ethanolamine transporter FLVCR1 n=1 Tax=Hypsibius exemplaris TaxID=2072580 RepID=A0A1W0X512_HYPEX|nr:Feline leukemia virus subgroup C receptor-related protein 1 [Hypsibius exemplaris]
MALDVDNDDEEAKVPLQSSTTKPIKVIANATTADMSRTNGNSSATSPDSRHNRNGSSSGDETIPLRKMDKEKSPAAVDGDAMYGKPRVVRADSRVYGVSHMFDRVTRFVSRGPNARRSDAFAGTLEENVPAPGEPQYRTTPRRWIMLTVFALYSMSNAFQWISYGIISDKIALFYGVGTLAVDWLSMIYMLTYIPLVFPAMWLLDKKGLRIVALIGSFGNFIGSAIKCFSPYPDRFVVTFVGQTISAISQIFILGLPARLAAVWFGAGEVALATAIGCFGNQLGVALGFLLPPILVPTVDVSVEGLQWDPATNQTIITDAVTNLTRLDLYGQNLATMFYGSTAINGFLFLIVVFVFQNAPRYPASPAQFAVLQEAATTTYFNWILILFKNWNFWMLLLSYGINVGAFYGISTLLSRCILEYYPGEDENAGRVGVTIVLSGLVGSFIGGLWLSWSGNYKTTTFLIYLLSFLSMIAFTATLSLGFLWLVFVISACLGFFMTGYLPVGFEFAAEITYPAPEGTSSGLLNCSAQIFGFILTSAMSAIVEAYDPIAGNSMLAAVLLFGTIMTFFIKSDLRRTNVNNANAAALANNVPQIMSPPGDVKR